MTFSCNSKTVALPNRTDTYGSPAESPRFYAAVPMQSLDSTSRLVDDLIGYALDTLGVHHVELRVYEEQFLSGVAGPRG